LVTLTAARSGRPGAPSLRSLLEEETGPALTRSEAEERFLALIRKAQLLAPETNVFVGEYEVDFLCVTNDSSSRSMDCFPLIAKTV
jgi:hypothetical protein